MNDDYCVYYRYINPNTGKDETELLTDHTYSSARQKARELKQTLGGRLRTLLIVREEEDLSPLKG